MNAHQRRVFMNMKHRVLPLGCKVVVKDRYGKMHPGKISKHDSMSPNKCIVDFVGGDLDGRHLWVSIKKVRPTERRRDVPWYRLRRRQLLKGKK